MSVQAVAAVSSTGRWRALCSCGWEGSDHPVKAEAYRDRAVHRKACGDATRPAVADGLAVEARGAILSPSVWHAQIQAEHEGAGS